LKFGQNFPLKFVQNFSLKTAAKNLIIWDKFLGFMARKGREKNEIYKPTFDHFNFYRYILAETVSQNALQERGPQHHGSAVRQEAVEPL
jgi:hypothetical protein